MSAEFWAGILGLLGSVLLGIPAWQGLGDRQAFDNAKTLYDNDRAAADAIDDATRAEAARTKAYAAYRLSCDTYLAQALGAYETHRRLTLAGFALLVLAFALLIADALGREEGQVAVPVPEEGAVRS